VGLVLARHCTRSTGTYILEDTGLPGLPLSWSLILLSGSCLVGLPPIPWTEKTIDYSPFFAKHAGHCWRGDLLGRIISDFF
jgi:hypothetical protein